MKSDYYLRPATRDDFLCIKKLVWDVRINPTKLDWHRFTVAVQGAEVIGCVQWKPVPRGLTELASLAVSSKYRGKGIGRALIENFLENTSRPIFLTCLSSLGGLYQKFGFRVLELEEMPVYYRRLKKFSVAFMELSRRNDTLLVMKLG